MLPGVAPDEQDDDGKDTTLSLIAKGLPGTLLKRLPASLLSGVHPAELAEQADTWLTAMTDTLSRFVSHLPRPTALAEPGLTLSLGPCTLSVRRGVVWVSEPSLGASLFMDMVDPVQLAGAGGAHEALIPLTRTNWLTLFDEATVSGKSTETLAQQGMLLPALASFHALAFNLERLNRRLAVVDDANLERERTTSRRTAEKAARQRLFNIYDQPIDRDAPGVEGHGSGGCPGRSSVGIRESISGFQSAPGPSDSPVGLVDVLDASGVRARRVRFKGRGRVVARRQHRDCWRFRAKRRPACCADCRECSGATGKSTRSASAVSAMTADRAAALEQEAWMFYRPLPPGERETSRLAANRPAMDRPRMWLRMVIAGLPGGLIKLLPALALGFVANHIVAGGSAGTLYAVAVALAAVRPVRGTAAPASKHRR